MKEYNTAFFSLYETWFDALNEEFGKEKTLLLFARVMETMLSKAYGVVLRKNDPQEFIRLVKQRDENVGVTISFHNIRDDQFVYRFHVDVFPNLKDKITSREVSETYIRFKINYILGYEWDYKVLKHFWNGDECTDFLIYRASK